MVEQKKSHQASHQAAAENSNQRGNARTAAPERRKGTFYLVLAAWWPTVKGCRRLTRKGVRKRLQALEEPQ